MTLTTSPVLRRRPVGVAAGLALAIGVLGLAVGAIWWAVAPRIEIVRTESGYSLTANAVYLDQLESPVAAEGSFLFVALGTGAVLALLTWLVLRRQRGPMVLVGLALGSLLGAWLAWRFGVWLDLRRFENAAATTPVGGHLDAPLSLHIDRFLDLDIMKTTPAKLTGVVAVQPLVAAIVYTMLASFTTDPGLRPRSEWTDDEYDEVSPAQLSPAQASPAQVSPEQASPEQVSPEQASPEQASREQASPEQASPSWDLGEPGGRSDRPAPPAAD